ncbi:hypothetical protein BGZ83_003588, partial [Gryganskiella cystojenkinii]
MNTAGAEGVAAVLLDALRPETWTGLAFLYMNERVIEVPGGTTLSFWPLADALEINILLFSTRCFVNKYQPRNGTATRSIGLVHIVDFAKDCSTYVVLDLMPDETDPSGLPEAVPRQGNMTTHSPQPQTVCHVDVPVLSVPVDFPPSATTNASSPATNHPQHRLSSPTWSEMVCQAVVVDLDDPQFLWEFHDEDLSSTVSSPAVSVSPMVHRPDKKQAPTDLLNIEGFEDVTLGELELIATTEYNTVLRDDHAVFRMRERKMAAKWHPHEHLSFVDTLMVVFDVLWAHLKDLIKKKYSEARVKVGKNPSLIFDTVFHGLLENLQARELGLSRAPSFIDKVWVILREQDQESKEHLDRRHINAVLEKAGVDAFNTYDIIVDTFFRDIVNEVEHEYNGHENQGPPANNETDLVPVKDEGASDRHDGDGGVNPAEDMYDFDVAEEIEHERALGGPVGGMEDDSHNKQPIRTTTVTLKSILRPEVLPYYEFICDTL